MSKVERRTLALADTSVDICRMIEESVSTPPIANPVDQPVISATPQTTPSELMQGAASNTPLNANMLSPLEARVLGCLIEKEICTPDVYPLTLNALVNAANQRNNRDPIIAAKPEDIEHALDGLRQKNLATHFAGAEARVAKFKQTLDRVYPLEPTTRVLMAELLLRGPQTTAELRTRGERMAPMPATALEIEQILIALSAPARANEPLTFKLPPQRGQKEARWTQLLTGAPDTTSLASAATPAPVTVTQTLPQEVEQRLAALEIEVTKLRQELDALHKSLGGQ